MKTQAENGHNRCAAHFGNVQLTLEKSGGGFFPLHRFESAHTAFLIIVRRFCFVSSLEKKEAIREDKRDEHN